MNWWCSCVENFVWCECGDVSGDCGCVDGFVNVVDVLAGGGLVDVYGVVVIVEYCLFFESL